MRIEDERPDVLQNIEFAIVQVYQNHQEMTDYAVTRTYEALIDTYAAERAGRQPRPWSPTELEQEMFEAVKTICEWRLGRESLGTDSGTPLPPHETIDVETLQLCLKRLRKSVRKWTRLSGRQGYLSFMSRFIK